MSTQCDTVCNSDIASEHENEYFKLSVAFEYFELSEESEFCAESNEEDNNDNICACIDISNCTNENSLQDDLRTLIIERNMQHNTANQLLRILRKHGHVELPTDVRLLLYTPRNASANIQCISNGHYVHFGLSTTVERSI